MKKQNTKPVTVAELKKIISPEFARINKRLNHHDKRFEGMDRRFLTVNMRIDNLDMAMLSFQKEMRGEFNKLHNALDAFIKCGEANEREILFLGRQHDDLAKFCTQKIGYPAYGRNL